MRDDNVYTRSTAHLRREPKQQQEERDEEEIHVRNEYPIIDEVIKRLDQRIEHYSSIDAIDVTDDTEKFMHQVEANKLVKAHLEVERRYLDSLITDYVKRS